MYSENVLKLICYLERKKGEEEGNLILYFTSIFISLLKLTAFPNTWHINTLNIYNIFSYDSRHQMSH